MGNGNAKVTMFFSLSLEFKRQMKPSCSREVTPASVSQPAFTFSGFASYYTPRTSFSCSPYLYRSRFPPSEILTWHGGGPTEWGNSVSRTSDAMGTLGEMSESLERRVLDRPGQGRDFYAHYGNHSSSPSLYHLEFLCSPLTFLGAEYLFFFLWTLCPFLSF